MQGDPPPRARDGHLPEQAAQAAAGLEEHRSAYGTYRRRRHPPREAARDLAHLHLRHRAHPGQGDLLDASTSIPSTRVRDLTDEEVARIRNYIDGQYKVEGDLRREVQQDIKRKMEIGCYQGIRHRRGLPVHGQRTHTNARTRKGPKKTVAGKKKARK